MAYGRIDNTIYFHGAIANGLMRAGTKAEDTHVCATITLLDGLVFARSHFNHSMNYRCVVAFGTLREVTSLDEKRAALVAVMNHAATDRARVSREPDENEMRITRVVALELTEASLKARTGPPMDGTFAENADYACWTGVIPLAIRAGAPITAETNAAPDAPVPVLPRIASA